MFIWLRLKHLASYYHHIWGAPHYKLRYFHFLWWKYSRLSSTLLLLTSFIKGRLVHLSDIYVQTLFIDWLVGNAAGKRCARASSSGEGRLGTPVITKRHAKKSSNTAKTCKVESWHSTWSDVFTLDLLAWRSYTHTAACIIIILSLEMRDWAVRDSHCLLLPNTTAQLIYNVPTDWSVKPFHMRADVARAPITRMYVVE